MTSTNNLLIINRYKCPVKGKVTSQAHEIDNGAVTKSYPKMTGDDLSFFKDYKTIIVCDVVRSSNLSDVNVITTGE